MGFVLWQLNDASWRQDEAGTQFSLETLHGRSCEEAPAAPLDRLLGARLHPATSTPCADRYFPPEFQFCPACGQALPAVPHDEFAPWIAPFGSANGLKVLAQTIEPAATTKACGESFPLPLMNSLMSFASLRLGAQGRLLIALQRDVGQVWVHRADGQPKWLALKGRVGEDLLPGWAWSMASDLSETGCAIPSREGPVWMTVDWATNQLQMDRGVGASVGGAARLKDCVLAPVMRAGNLVMLMRRDGDANWSDCETPSDPAAIAAQLTRAPGQQAFFGTPVVDEVRLVAYWPCRGGYVRVGYPEPQAKGRWSFRPWSSSQPLATAKVEIGVPYRKTGARPGYWQLCEIPPLTQSSRDDVQYKIFKFDGDEAVDCEEVESGQFVTTGRAAFSWLYDHWSDVHQVNSNVGEQTELRYPILQFGEKGLVLMAKLGQWEGREDPGLFTDVFRSRMRATGFARFVIQGSGFPGEALTATGVDAKEGVQGSQFRIAVAHLPDIVAFIHQSQLFLYFPDDSNCYRWPLQTFTES